MLLNQVKYKLDMKCKLYINMFSYIFRIAKVNDVKLPVFLREYNNNIYLKILICKDSYIIKNLMPFLDSEEKDDYYIITEKLNDDNIKELIDDLYKVKSLSMGSLSIENGKLIIRFRFHHNYSKKVSDVLSLKIMKPLFIDKIEYEPLENLFSTMSGEKVPVSVVRYKIPYELYKNNDIINTIKNNDALVEILDTYMDTDIVKAIIYSNTKIKGMDKICNNIYETTIKTDLLKKLRERLSNLIIQRYGIFGTVDDNYIIITVFLSSYRKIEYIKEIMSNSHELNGKNIISLDIAKQLDNDIIKYL